MFDHTLESEPRTGKGKLTRGSWLRFCLLAAALASTTGCVPLLPQLFIFPALVPCLIVGLALFVAGSKKPALRAEGIYLTSLYLLVGAGYTLAGVMLFGSSAAAYVVSLAVATASGVIAAGAARAFNTHGVPFVSPKYAGLFGFLLFFLINFGYNVTLGEMNNFRDTDVEELSRAVFGDVMLSGQLPYLALVLVPAAVGLAWLVDSYVRKCSWDAVRVVRVNLWALWAGLVVSIIAGVVVRGNTMASALLGLEQSEFGGADKARLKDLYLALSDFRSVLFLISFHDLLVVACLTLGIIAVAGTGKLYESRNTIAVAAVLAAVLLSFLPFYIGQKELLDYVVGSLGGQYAEQVELRNEFMDVRAFYPSSVALKHLLVSLTAGGALAFSLNLPGVKLQLGK